jgi:hypothetical protein
MTNTLAIWCIRFAGALSFLQLAAMFFAPRMLRWSEELATLSPLSRRIIGVITFAIVLVVQGTGIVTLLGAEEIARGTPLGSAFAALMATFWGYRACMQRTYAPLWPEGALGRLSHLGLSSIFWTQALLFGAAFARGLIN